jgi:hypothetical protein
MSNQAQKYIFFYSNYCVHSQKAMKQLFKTPIYNNCVKVCVDDKKNLIPPTVTCVPTIFLPGNPAPISGSRVFQWIEGLSNQKTSVNGGGKDIEAFHSGEMSGFSDGYSYIGGTSTNASGMNHSYSFVGSGEQKINTPNEETGSGNQGSSSVGKSELEQQYDKLMRDRDTEMPKPAMRQ